MKRFLLLSLFAMGLTFGASAQCTPDAQYTDPGVYPDSATGLASACIDQAYLETITIIVPVDSTIEVAGFPVTLDFDSVVISNWQGLPPGFTYACLDNGNTMSPVDGCAFEGNTTGCVAISGNPTASDIGSYQQIITTDAYLTPNPLGNPVTTDVDYYYIHIVDCTNGIGALTSSKFLVYPNPSKGAITLNGLNDISVEEIRVLDMEGQEMMRYSEVSGGALDMNLNHLSSGMYFVEINYNGTTERVKFILE